MEAELLEYAARFASFSEEEKAALIANTPIHEYKKGALLLREGQLITECFFVLKGIVRQYIITEGIEKTTAFFMEKESVNAFADQSMQTPASQFWECLEDCVLVVGNLNENAEIFKNYPQFEAMTRKMMEEDFGKMQAAFTKFMISSPEERYLNLLDERPQLLQRVPQHQLASYLGVTPESLSRIKKRIQKKH